MILTCPRPITQDDLEKIEKRMRQIIAGGYEFVKKVVSAKEARDVFKDQPYKLELIEGLEKGGLDEYGNPLVGKAGNQPLPERHFHGPVPGSACRDHPPDQSFGA